MDHKIKLIATDVDGTLVKDSSREVYDEMIEVIQKLTDAGYHFVVASGRQYGSIRRMFERSKRRLHYIAENGAHIILNGENYSVTKMDRADVEGIMTDLRALYPQGCHVVASTAKGCFLESKDSDFINLIANEYRNDVTLTDDILAENVDIIKLAVYKKGTIRPIGESMLIPKWQDKVKTTMAGEEWVDFMDQSVDKGNALRKIQEALGISREETMVFGDNNNDLGLILAAEESYAVENAVEEVKKAAKHICPDYTQKGVYRVLKQLT
ncbi:MAG: HAD family hydrolase [Lachnospiraceae bacterium]